MPKINLFSFILIALFATSLWATDTHNHDIETPMDEIELSEAAIQNYGLKTTRIVGEKITLPASAIVTSQDTFFVYLTEGKHFSQIEIHPTQISSDFISFDYHTDAPYSDFVITGAPYLRIVFLNNANPITGHTH